MSEAMDELLSLMHDMSINDLKKSLAKAVARADDAEIKLRRVLDILDLEEAEDNGHDVIGAAQLLAQECHEMGFALINSARAIEAERNLWKPYTDRWLGLDTALSILRNEECRACLPGDGPEGKDTPHTHRGNCLVSRPARGLLCASQDGQGTRCRFDEGHGCPHSWECPPGYDPSKPSHLWDNPGPWGVARPDSPEAQDWAEDRERGKLDDE